MGDAVIGVVGMGVMGHNLILNIGRNGYSAVGFDRKPDKIKQFLEGPAAGLPILGTSSFYELAKLLHRPRCILLMVPAGQAVDSIIEQLLPNLDQGDILIDGGNSFFQDTDRRTKELKEKGFLFLGMGVSGGASGALLGPSMMPGGMPEAWHATRVVLESIAARANDGMPCVTFIGPRGAGHYVKMVHNGIEYGDMQLIAEIYDLLHRGAGLTSLELSEIFNNWNETELHSYLIEITAKVLAKIDSDTHQPLVDLILDEAQQKGTGKWTSQNALDLGSPIPTIDAAVTSRNLSSLKTERSAASHVLHGPRSTFHGSRDRLIAAARDALYASKITSYAQGLALLKSASKEYEYDLSLSDIAAIWRAGCIIRADLLEDIRNAYRRGPELDNLLLDEVMGGAVQARQNSWRRAVKTAIDLGIPVLATNASLAYFDAYRSERLPANLVQGQRDFFGAHTYRRIDREGIFTTDWEK
jgi:6-phosphogluconate dehydrogenase